MMMMRTHIKILLWLLLAPVVFSACDAEPVTISITMEEDYSQIIEAINSTNQTLTAKMSLIESALSQGFADDNAAQELLRKAVSSLTGSAKEKLGAVETAVRSGTASLEMKLGLIEAAMADGFADGNAQLALIRTAISSLSGTLAEKLAAVETAVNSQTTSLATKLGVIETTLTEGLADEKEARALLHQAVEALDSTAAERLLAIEQAVEDQTTSLATKLGLIDASLEKGLVDSQESLLLIGQAVAALDSTMDDKLQAIEAAVRSGTTGLTTKLGLIEAAVASGFVGQETQQELLQQAVKTLDGTLEAKLAAVTAAAGSQATSLQDKLGLIKTALSEGFAADSVQQKLIRLSIQSLDGTLEEKLSAIQTVITDQTDSLTLKLKLIQGAWEEGVASDTTALGLIARTISNSTYVTGIVDKIKVMETTLDEKVPQTLSDIFTAVAPLTGYREILIAINRTLYDIMGHSINGHEYIEMGPGRKWATMNVGATLPEEEGDYYAWGDVEPYYTSLDPLVWKDGKSGGYVGENYKWVEHGGTHDDRPPEDRITKYTLKDDQEGTWWYNWDDDDWFRGDQAAELGDPQYDYADDVARQDWGATWRIPTKADWEWLMENCTWEWTTDYKGKSGILITSYIPGFEFNQIFLPNTDRMIDEHLPGWGFYWSSTLHDTRRAYFVYTTRWEIQFIRESRFLGITVRPVSD